MNPLKDATLGNARLERLIDQLQDKVYFNTCWFKRLWVPRENSSFIGTIFQATSDDEI
jgi:hypothetical protein